jgi:uncharacterized repeat protein (TIGR01451 family)
LLVHSGIGGERQKAGERMKAQDFVSPARAGSLFYYSIRVFLRFIILITMLTGWLLPARPATAVGGAYGLTFTAADPRPDQGPYAPTYPRFAPAGLPCPTPSGGRATNPLVDAVYASPLPPHAIDSVTSMAPGDMVLGEIVPFEIQIKVDGNTAPEGGVIRFLAGWDTMTTSGDGFGYDPAYGVYCAFVDAGDAYSDDTGNNASVDWFSDTMAGTEIQGEFQVSGLESGDEVILEVWMVLMDELPDKATGNVQSRMISAQTGDGDTISLGNQTIPLLRVGSFLTASVDLGITKVDVPNEPLAPGDLFDYVIQVTNLSSDTVSNGVVITDTLDLYTQFQAVEVYDPGALGRTCLDPLAVGGGEMYCDLKALTPQETVTITVTVLILPGAPNGSTIETPDCTYGDYGTYDLCNQVVLNSTITQDDNSENNSDTEPKDVVAVADIGLQMFCPVSPVGGDGASTTAIDQVTCDFVVIVTNYGPDPSSGVVLTDTIPLNTTLLSYTSTLPATELDNDPLVLALNDPLPVAVPWEVVLTVDVTNIISVTTITITNTAVVTAETPQPSGATAPDADSCSVTPANLAYFLVEPVEGEWIFNWQSLRETGTLGYNLFQETPEGWEMINQTLISTREMYSDSARSYKINLPAGDSEKFMLDEVDAFGRARRHGPFFLGQPFGSLAVEKPTNWQAILDEHEFKERMREQTTGDVKSLTRASTPQADLAGLDQKLFLPMIGQRALASTSMGRTFDPLDLAVEEEGIYRVTYEDLHTAGFDWANVEPASITLLNRGASVPLYVQTLLGADEFGPGSFIEFFGQGIESQYTRRNIYTLTQSKSMAQRLFQNNDSPIIAVEPVTSYRETVLTNRNLAYAMGAPTSDPWFEKELKATNIPSSADFTIQIDSMSPGAAPVLMVGLWGMTDHQGFVDHHVVVELNDVNVAEITFDGIFYHEVQASLPEGVLKNGANILSIVLPGDSGVESRVAIDRYQVSFERAFSATNDTLKYQAVGEWFEVNELSSSEVVVYRLGKRLERLNGSQVVDVGGHFQVKVPGSNEAATYFMAAQPAWKKPVKITRSASPGEILNGKTDLLILAHPDFLDAVEPLVKAREAEGLAVRLVNIEDVYAVFNDKIVDPRAIQEYIGHAWESMQARYVLLVGADTYDYLDYGGTGSFSFIPTVYAPTHPFVRHTPLDSLLGDVNGDQRPDVIVGRFPVRSNAEAEALVAKTLAYANKDYGKTAIFSADAKDGTLSFAKVSQSWIQNLPAGWNVKTAYLEDAGGLASARQALIDGINAGQALVNYIGHSSDVQWSDQGLLTLQDAAALTNTLRPAVFSQWSCFNTYLAWPNNDTLAHALLVYGEQGGSAVIGSATLTGQDVHEALGSRVIAYLVTPGMRIGDALQAARHDLVLENSMLAGLINAYQLLGDPTLVIDP